MPRVWLPRRLACLAVARRRRVKPVALFPFHHELPRPVALVCSGARLCDQVQLAELPCWEPLRELLRDHFDLPVDHLSSKLVDCDMHPVMLFFFNEEVVLISAAILMPCSKKPRVIAARV